MAKACVQIDLLEKNQMSLRSDSIFSRLTDTNPLRFAWRRSLLRFAFLILAVVLGFSSYAVAQQATIVGTVTDPSGAALPNVNITVTNTESGAAKNILTNTAGQYVIPDLNIGHYKVRAEATGFKSRKRTMWSCKSAIAPGLILEWRLAAFRRS